MQVEVVAELAVEQLLQAVQAVVEQVAAVVMLVTMVLLILAAALVVAQTEEIHTVVAAVALADL
jgi:hypothetical protein